MAKSCIQVGIQAVFKHCHFICTAKAKTIVSFGLTDWLTFFEPR